MTICSSFNGACAKVSMSKWLSKHIFGTILNVWFGIHIFFLNWIGVNEKMVYARTCQPNTAHLAGTCRKPKVKLNKGVSLGVCFCDTNGCNIGNVFQSTRFTLILIIFCFLTLMII
jgi:hypothetical protein